MMQKNDPKKKMNILDYFTESVIYDSNQILNDNL